MLVPTQTLIHPTTGCRPLCRIVVSNVLIIKRIRKGVLRNDIKIPSIKIGISFMRWLFKAFGKNHIGRDKPSRIGSPINKTVFGKVGQHVSPIHPAEPVFPLAAKSQILSKAISRNPTRKKQGRTHGNGWLTNPPLENKP